MNEEYKVFNTEDSCCTTDLSVHHIINIQVLSSTSNVVNVTGRSEEYMGVLSKVFGSAINPMNFELTILLKD